MKIKNEEVYIALVGLQGESPLKSLSALKLPVKTSYNIAKLNIKLTEQFRLLETTRQSLLRKYGEVSGGSIIIPEFKIENGKELINTNWNKFQEEWMSLMSMEIEIDFNEKINLSKLEVNIESNILAGLYKFIEVI